MKKTIGYFFLGLIVITAIGLTLIRFLLPFVEGYKCELENKIYELTEIPVSIGELDAVMHGFNPEIILKDIRVLSNTEDSDKQPIKLEELRLGINWLDLILTRQLLPSSWITLVGAELSIVREQDGTLSIEGLNSGGSKHPYWLLSGGKYQVLKSSITWLDKQRHAVPMTFEHIDLLIKNNPDMMEHEIHLLSQLPETMGKALRVSMSIQGDVFETDNFNGLIYIKGSDVQLAEILTGDKPLDLKITAGTGDFEIWSQWQKSKTTALKGNVQAANLSIKKQKKTFEVEMLRTDFHASNQPYRWQFGVTDFIAKTNNKTSPAATFELSGNNNNQLAAAITSADLRQLSEFIHFFSALDNEKKSLITQLNLKGCLKDLSGYYDGKNNTYAINGVFENVFVSSAADFPEIENLTGSIQGTNEQGVIGFNTLKGSLFFSNLFRKPIIINQLSGQISWQQKTDHWFVESEQLVLNVKDLETKSKLVMKIPDNDNPIFMDLHSSFSRLDDVSSIPDYYPVNIMHGKVLNWLDNAFVSGQINKGGLLVYGELDQFPYAKGQGVFEVLLDATEVELQFAPDWPRLKKVNAEIAFQKDSLTVTAEHARADGMNITQTLVKIPSFEKSDYLLVEGRAQGRIANGLGFLQKTPLHNTVDIFLDEVIPSGFFELELDFKIPFVDGLKAEVNGMAYINQAALNIKSIDLDITKIVAEINFNEMGLFSDSITASTLGYPIDIKMGSHDFNTYIKGKGKTDILQLQKQFGFLNSKLLTKDPIKGEINYQVTMDVSAKESKATKLAFKTDLAGVSMELPGLLKKNTFQNKDLNLNLLLNEAELLPISLNYNDDIKIEMNIDRQQSVVHSAHIVYGNGQAVMPIEKGITVDINQDDIDMSEWVNLLSRLDNAEPGSAQNINKISFNTKNLQWKDFQYGAFELAVKPFQQQWQGRVECSAAKGKFSIPFDRTGENKIKLKMIYLDLAEAMKIDFQGHAFAEGVLPLVDVLSEQFLWDTVNLGRLEINSERIPQGYRFKRINVSTKDYEISMTADWVKQDKGDETHFSGTLSASDMGSVLSQTEMTDDLKETTANIGYSGHWPKSPFQFSLASMNAEIDVQLKDGRISSIEPGFGRVLGLIAIEQWGKRLSFDFGDVYKKGLSFNSINGSFKIAEGKAKTTDLLVDAIPARISIKGDADLIEKTLDYKVSVIPKSASAIPIAGDLVGEIAGSISKVLISDYEEGYFFGSKYIMTGRWDDINVTAVVE